MDKKLRIGLVLGSGSARGWSHIGVINALARLGIVPDVVCGCSIGSVVAASYATGKMDRLEEWVYSLTRLDVARLFDINLSMNGFVDLERLQTFLTSYVCDDKQQIESVGKVFASVATDLETGREVWFTEGSMSEAVWASMSLPGIFPPVRQQGRWLVDGGLVNPVPISLCRAMGAQVVIAVNLNGDIVGKHFYHQTAKEESKPDEEKVGLAANLTKSLKEYSSLLFPANDKIRPPGVFESLASSVNITQDRITRSRMAGDPPDIILTPKLSYLGLLEFYRAEEAIAEGERCVIRMREQLQDIMDVASYSL